jgi:hypothetical protein
MDTRPKPARPFAIARPARAAATHQDKSHVRRRSFNRLVCRAAISGSVYVV